MAGASKANEVVHTTRWGILATGWMAKVFVKDLLSDPLVRGVTDVRHEVVAIASSSSVERAAAFIEEHGVPRTAKAYGSYEELVADPNIDIVYVATPHSHHFQNAMLALCADKPVLVEKAFTTNARQAKVLVETARGRNMFLMEALWTRYLPVSTRVRQLVADGAIGDIQRVIADTSFSEDVESKWGTQNRIVNMSLAGGALLDLGIYSLTWVFQILYHLQPSPRQGPESMSAAVTKYQTGADEQTTVLLTFPNLSTREAHDGTHRGGNLVHAIATCGMRAGTDPDMRGSSGPSVRIQGTKGEIQLLGPSFRPTGYRLIPKVDTTTGLPVGSIKEVEDVEFAIPGPGLEKGGHGMFYEADEASRCLRDGKLESEILDWQETLVIMNTMDQVRAQHGIVYPESIETAEYPVSL